VSTVDFLVKFRDAAKLIAEACEEYLAALAPPEAREEQKQKPERGWSWNPRFILWNPAEGPSGPYERACMPDNGNFQLLIRDLQAHGGKLTREGWFYWLFGDGRTVGRKERGKGINHHGKSDGL
jgi:hypothetical protein